MVLNCAHLLLNGPLFYDKPEIGSNPFVEKRLKKCYRCCENCKKNKNGVNVIESDNKKLSYAETNKNKKIKMAENSENKSSCNCSCICFGDYRPANCAFWKKSITILPFFKEEDVLLVFNSKVEDLKEIKGTTAQKLLNQVFFIYKV